MPMLSRIHRSVFTRLLLGILVTGLLINLVVFIFFGHFRLKNAAAYDRILGHYADTLSAAIGDPPDENAAKTIAAATGFVIRYNGPHGAWSTGEATNPLPPLSRFHMRRVNDRTTIGFRRGHHFIRRSVGGGGELVFAAVRSEDMERSLHGLMVLVLVALSGIIGLAYLFIRRIFMPLRGLRTGVAAVHEGQLDHRVPVVGAQEFRDLAEAFNDMTARVQKTLQSKEQLLLDVSHELRSPITRMKLSAELLPDGDLKRSLAEDLQEMEAMVSAILEAARMQHMAEALRREPADLGELVNDTAREFQGRAPGIDIGEAPPVTLSLDVERMRTVIRNLLDNALKYSNTDGPPVVVSWRTEGDEVILWIADKGLGISPEALHRVFEPFFREDESRSRDTGGFGLGLSLCKAIVTAHRGTLDIASTPGAGTTVTVRLTRS